MDNSCMCMRKESIGHHFSFSNHFILFFQFGPSFSWQTIYDQSHVSTKTWETMDCLSEPLLVCNFSVRIDVKIAVIVTEILNYIKSYINNPTC